jgi:hypothetical protein
MENKTRETIQGGSVSEEERTKRHNRLVDSYATMIAFGISVLGIGVLSKIFGLGLSVVDAVIIVGVIRLVVGINTIERLMKEGR